MKTKYSYFILQIVKLKQNIRFPNNIIGIKKNNMIYKTEKKALSHAEKGELVIKGVLK